jgi:sterol desaturase/sphingolipid hydroxylase (fatty acid hydroxylase superfamily)
MVATLDQRTAGSPLRESFISGSQSNRAVPRPINPKRHRDTFSLCIMSTILLVILILLLIGALPAWPYSRGWGYYPSGGLGLILVILIILAVLGTI